MADHSEKKPASGAEITLAGKHAFSKLKDAAKMAIQPSAKGHTIRNGIAAVHAQEAKFLDGPTSGAEITEVSPHSLKMSTRKDRPSGKKGDLFNRMFHRVARFPSDETIIGDSGQDQDILIRERDGGPNLSSMPRQDTAASQEDTATLVGSPHLSNLSLFSTTSFQQTAIINFSSIPHTRYEDTLVQQPFKTTFFDNIAPPFFRTPLPKPNQRFNSTLQLAYGRYLLLAKKRSLPSPMPDSLGTVEDEIQAMGLEETDRLWMSDISKDPTEQDRLRWLTAKVVCQFLKSNHKDEMSIAEVALLGSVLECQDHRDVLSFFIGQLEQESLLNEKRLLGLMQFLQSASPGYLIDDDLVRILKALYKRLEGTYIQLGDTKKPASKHIYLLAIAVSRVLDAMVEGNVKGLNRTEDYEPLRAILNTLKDGRNIYLKYQATYALQALKYIGDDESPLNTVLRVGRVLAVAGSGVAGVLKLDIKGLFDGLDGLSALGDAAGQVIDATKAVIESVQTARDAGEGLMISLLEGFRTGEKRAWYPALQGARVFIREGRLAEFKRVVYEAPCRREQEFQWGVCQLLGEMAVDPIWGTEICQQAVYFLEDLHRSDSVWTKDSNVREAIRGIFLRISKGAEKDIPIHINSQDSRPDNGDNSVEPYPLIARLPIPESSLLLAEVLKLPSLEYDLHRIMACQLNAYKQAVYIPPRAKANLKASDDDNFPLIDKVMDFLKSEREVFLILGNSGSGKSTFNRHLHYVLTKNYVLTKSYNHDDLIPIFIHLPTISNPGTELISKHLKTLNFTDDDIQELKRDRQFIIICDSYDESRIEINLHKSNMLNYHGQWSAKMIISCRSTHAHRDYLDRFQPQPLNPYGESKSHLFQEATVVPFSESQIKVYVDQFVQGPEVHRPFPDGLAWSAAEYMDKLTKIPNLLPLVKNPFLLNLSLKTLPKVLNNNLDPSIITITRPKLFKIFINEWLEVNRQRLGSMDLSEAAKEKLRELNDGDFKNIAIEFLQNLAKAIYKEQAGHSSIRYVHRDDKETWKAKFFGPDDETMLLRQSSPLTCVENMHSFIHRSLLEYFYSQVATILPTNKRENEQPENTPRISQTNNQQKDLSREHPTPNDQYEQGNLPSPSATPPPSETTHNIMPSSTPNAPDPGSPLSSPNFPPNTFQGTTLRDTCDDATLDDESDGSESDDDKFEDAPEFISSDPSERITQSAPTSKPAVTASVSWFRRVLSAGGAPRATAVAVSAAGTVAHGAEYAVGPAAAPAAVASGACPVAHGAEYAVGPAAAPGAVASGAGPVAHRAVCAVGPAAAPATVASGASPVAHGAEYADKWAYEDILDDEEDDEEVEVVVHDNEETTTTTVTTEEVAVTTEDVEVVEEVNPEIIFEESQSIIIIDPVEVTTENEVVVVPVVVPDTTAPKGTSWFHRALIVSEAAAHGVGPAAGSGAGAVASDADLAAVGAIYKIDGVWKHKVQVITTRKAHVDEKSPIAKTSYVYYDDDVYDAVLVDKETGNKHVTQLVYDTDSQAYYVYYRWSETDYKLDGPHKTIESAKDAFQVTYKEKFDVEWTDREVAPSDKWTYETVTHETFDEVEEVEDVVYETEVEKIVAHEANVVVDTIATTVTTEEVAIGEEIVVEEKIVNDVIVEAPEVVSEETTTTTVTTEEVTHEAENAVGAVAVGTGVAVIGAGLATEGAIQKTDRARKRKARVNKMSPMDDDEVKEEVVVDAEVTPSPRLPECKISGIPASFGDLTAESLVSEMSASPVFDDQSFGEMDLEKEPDILQFLVERVHEDPDYTKLLLWTVYKLGAEGIVNQSTKNAMCILEMAGIHFQLQV